MEQFLRDNWLALLSLVIALSGGVPGIITLVQHLQRRSRFVFTLMSHITGEIRNEATGDEATMVLLTGTASNSGDRPLSPSAFGLRVHAAGRWYDFERMLIPKGAVFGSEQQQIDIPEASRSDLQLLNRAITTGEPVTGHLMFYSKQVSVDVLRDASDLRFEVTCVDVLGTSHSAKIEPARERLGGIQFPKHGVTVQPKQR